MKLSDPVTADPSFKWERRHARHLLNRAGFGVPYQGIDKLTQLGAAGAVDALVDFEDFNDVGPTAPTNLPYRDYKEMREEYSKLSTEEKQKFQRMVRREEVEAMVGLQGWWIERMVKTQRPLQEKLALMWHGHFATSAEKLKNPKASLELNEIFRKHGSGNFKTLVSAVGKSRAMMRYLDQDRSTKAKPNENWARELMELFTLGIGNYTENDIKEAARAFTGWTIRDGKFFEATRLHDDGNKTIFGASGNFNGDAVIDMLMAHPACAKFIARKVATFFAYDNPEPELVDNLAETLLRHNYELKPMLHQLFISSAFYQERAYYSQIKSPAQLVVGLISQLGVPVVQKPPIAQYAMRAMGQSLFYPPNVKGWDGGRAWINTNTLLVRYNYSNFLVSGVVPDLGKARGGIDLGKKDIEKALMRNSMDADDSMQGGMMDDGMDSIMGPEPEVAGQDAMPRDIPSQTLYSAIKARRRTNPSERAMAIAPFEARDFFRNYEGKNSDQILDALMEFFVGFPLDEKQRAKLQAALAQGVPRDAPVPVSKMSEEDLRATVQLLLSTVEYQVC